MCISLPHWTTHPKQPLVPTNIVSAMVLPLILSTSSKVPCLKYLLGMLPSIEHRFAEPELPV